MQVRLRISTEDDLGLSRKIEPAPYVIRGHPFPGKGSANDIPNQVFHGLGMTGRDAPAGVDMEAGHGFFLVPCPGRFPV